MSGTDRLGRGLGALLGEYMQEPLAPGGKGTASVTLPVRAIVPNPFQPRRKFQPQELAELAASIKASGLIQPIVARKSPSGRSYELVAGERRLRAVKQLGWTEIPVQVRDVDDQTLLILALVENIQREDLSPLEEARGYEILRDKFGITQARIAEAVGRKRSTVANMLRLLGLPPSVRRLLEEGSLTMGHARAILSVEDPVRAANLARTAVADSWSVRETEKRVRETVDGGTARRVRVSEKLPQRGKRDPAVEAMEEALEGHLEARVAIQWKNNSSGAIRIHFQGARELERVFLAMTGKDVADIIND